MGAIFEFYLATNIPNDGIAVGTADAAVRETRKVEGSRSYTGTLAECTRVELVQEIAENVAVWYAKIRSRPLEWRLS